MIRKLLCLLLLAVTTAPAAAQNLRLEYAQQGDPQNPRALILIHGAFTDRTSLRPVLAQWGAKSWALAQYCSVYSYQYPADLTNLKSFDDTAGDLLNRIENNSFNSQGSPDQANPHRETRVYDNRQPKPTFKAGTNGTHLLVVGVGVGGIVAAYFANQAVAAGYTVDRVGVFDSPVSGIPTSELMIAMEDPTSAQAWGTSSMTGATVLTMSQGWQDLGRLRLKPPKFTMPKTEFYATWDKQTALLPRTPFDNVLYGAGTPITKSARLETDGVIRKPVALGTLGGLPLAIKGNQPLVGPLHKDVLTSPDLYTYLTHTIVDWKVIEDYLAGRANVEFYYQAFLGAKPHGLYWDDRYNVYKDVYSDPRGLYYYMWLFHLPTSVTSGAPGGTGASGGSGTSGGTGGTGSPGGTSGGSTTGGSGSGLSGNSP